MTDYNLGTVVGNGIASIEKTGTSGLVDTYTITYTNGDTTTFTVTNGKDGAGGADIVTSWETTPSDEKIPSEKLAKDTLDTKVDKISGKGLSENDFTTTLKNKLDGIESQANKYTHPSTKQCNYIYTHPSTKQCNYSYTHPTSQQCSVTIPTKISDLTNDSDFIETSSTAGLIKNDGTIDTSAYITSSALSNYLQKSSTSGLVKNDGTIDTNSYLTSSSLSTYIQKSFTPGLIKNDGSVDTSSYLAATKVTSWSGTVSDSNVPSEKLVKNSLDAKVSATKVTSWSSTTSDSNVPSEKLVKDSLDDIEDLIGDAITYINQ